MRIASVGIASTGWSLFTGVRQCPSRTGSVVTQFVTQTGNDHVQRPGSGILLGSRLVQLGQGLSRSKNAAQAYQAPGQLT